MDTKSVHRPITCFTILLVAAATSRFYTKLEFDCHSKLMRVLGNYKPLQGGADHLVGRWAVGSNKKDSRSTLLLCLYSAINRRLINTLILVCLVLVDWRHAIFFLCYQFVLVF
jgi:hypothetical protein